MPDTPLSPIARVVIVSVLIAGAFVSVLNQTLMLVAIPPIMADLNVTANEAQWVTTAFMLTSGVLIPVSAALIDRFSSRTLYLSALLIFLLGAGLGAIAQSFSQLILARVVQGASAGIIMPLIQTVMMSLYPPEKRGTAMGLVGLVIAFAPAIGPTLSGWLVDQYSWRSLFILLLPVALVVLGLAAVIMRDVTVRRHSTIDTLSVTLSSFGWGGLLYGFSLVGAEGWSSPAVLGGLSIGGVSLSLFIRRQLKMPAPMLDFHVFRSIVYRRTTVLSVMVFALMIGPQTMIPIYVQNLLERSALHTGLLLLPGAIVMGMMSPLAGRLFDRFGIRWLTVFGFSMMTIALALFSRLSLTTPSWMVGVLFSIHMGGLSAMMMPLITAGINSLPVKDISHGTAVNNTLRMVGGSIGTALLLTVMSAGATMAGPEVPVAAQLAGLKTAFTVAALVAFVGLVVAWQGGPASQSGRSARSEG